MILIPYMIQGVLVLYLSGRNSAL